MTSANGNHRRAGRRGRRGLSATMATIVLGVVVVAVGVAGYVVLTAVSHSSSSSQQTCSPSSLPQCDGKTHVTSQVVVPRLASAVASRS